MANTYLTRTQGSTGSETKGTFSAWVKRSGLTTASNMYTSYQADNEFCDIQFNSSDQLQVVVKIGGTDYLDLRTTRLFRDISAFYHILVAFDSTDGTQADRCKIYVNGTRETSFATNTNNVSSSLNMRINGSSQDPYIGSWHNQGNYFSGVMSHVHWVDGTAYTPTSFGESDSVSGIWKPKTAPSVTYGTNGFFLKMENSGAMGTDSSGNSNTFTVSGTLTQNVDTPSNNFATYNPLDNYYASSTFSNGNTTIVTNSGNTTYNTSTLGIPPTMKCYWETKFDTVQAANGEVGIVNTPTTGSAAGAYRLYYQTYGISVNDYGAIWSNNTNTGITLGTLSTSDIVCFAWDGVNQALYVRKNGDAWINSGDPTSGASKTGAVKTFTGTRTMFPAVGDQSGAHAVGTSTNFGSGYFGTTQVASAGTAPSESGIFEHDCPNGYQALCTKGINSF